MNASVQPDVLSVRFGRPIVFGPAARPLAGRLHETRGPTRGAVVICNPWGYEENCAFGALQLLARLLAESGYETLRFDYDGCGNSWGDFADADRVASWVASCGEAIAYMAARCERVSVVGLRLGAALAVLASAGHKADRVLLWDPVVSGRRYLRILRTMSMMGVVAAPDPTDPDGLVTIGHSLTAATVREIEAIDLKSLPAACIAEALLISRPGGSDAQRLAASLQRVGVAAAVEEHDGTDLLLDCAAEQSVIPRPIIERAVSFLTSGRPQESRIEQELLPGTATLQAPGGSAWAEEHFSLGSAGLAAVLTLPRQLSRAGVVLMVNNGVARSIGPARAWVQWARCWAALGIATLRVDLAGFGDSNARPNQTEGNHYPIGAIDDITLSIDYARSRGLTPAVTVGLCSGAFLGLDAAAAGAQLAGVFAINSQLFYVPDPPGAPERARRAAPLTHPWVQRFLDNTRVGRRLGRDMPYPFWWLLDLFRLHPSPLRGVAAARRRTPVLLIYGAENLGLQRLQQRDPVGLGRWRKDGSIVVMEGLDHSMFAPRIRSQVEIRAREFLTEHLPAATTVIGEQQAHDSVSATLADWSREQKRLLSWQPSQSLLASLRSYEQWRHSRSPWSIVMRKGAVLRHRFWSIVTGADIPLGTRIAGGLLLPHPNGIVIHPDATIGPNCLIFQQVTLGGGGDGAPKIGGHVDIGAGAKILGSVSIGDHAKIGANAVVIKNVPAFATAVGIPARNIEAARPEKPPA
jgi:serine O-acetyltransferase